MATTFISCEEAKQVGLIPKPFHPYIPEACAFCGGQMHISMSTTILKCSNPHCLRRVANQAEGLLKDLGIKGLGAEKLTDYCRMMKINSILEFIQYPPPPYDLIDMLNNLELTFPRLVQMLHIPNLGMKAFKLFKGVDSLAEFVDSISKSTDVISHIANLVGGTETAEQLYQIIIDNIDDLVGITEYVKVSKQVNQTILIAITGHISRVVAEDGRSLTKAQYVDCLNDYAKPCGFEFRQSSALASVAFVVADSQSGSRKYLLGAEREIIITSDKLLAVAKQIAEKNQTEV